MMRDLPHIAIDFPDYFPKGFEDEITEGFDNDSLDLRINRKEPTAWMASEWIIPGLIAVYVLKPYFESFLKEAGKDHYIFLKEKIKSILSKAKKIEVNTLASTGSEHKIDSSDTQSKAISVFFQTKDGRIIKLLFDNKLELEVWHNSAEVFMNILAEHYNGKSKNILSDYLEQIKDSKHRELYAFIDPETETWTLINNLGQYIKEKKAKKGTSNN